MALFIFGAPRAVFCSREDLVPLIFFICLYHLWLVRNPTGLSSSPLHDDGGNSSYREETCPGAANDLKL